MSWIENGTHTTNGLSTEACKFFRYVTAYGEKCLMLILTYLSCTKYDEINIGHSYI